MILGLDESETKRIPNGYCMLVRQYMLVSKLVLSYLH